MRRAPIADGKPSRNGEQGEGSCVKIVANGHVNRLALMAPSVAGLPDPWEELALPREESRLRRAILVESTWSGKRSYSHCRDYGCPG